MFVAIRLKTPLEAAVLLVSLTCLPRGGEHAFSCVYGVPGPPGIYR